MLRKYDLSVRKEIQENEFYASKVRCLRSGILVFVRKYDFSFEHMSISKKLNYLFRKYNLFVRKYYFSSKLSICFESIIFSFENTKIESRGRHGGADCAPILGGLGPNILTDVSAKPSGRQHVGEIRFSFSFFRTPLSVSISPFIR